MNTQVKPGGKIRILYLEGEADCYDGKKGTVGFIDSLGRLHGPWGSLAVIPEADRFIVIERAE